MQTLAHEVQEPGAREAAQGLCQWPGSRSTECCVLQAFLLVHEDSLSAVLDTVQPKIPAWDKVCNWVSASYFPKTERDNNVPIACFLLHFFSFFFFFFFFF
jgi:hypothetical protein